MENPFFLKNAKTAKNPLKSLGKNKAAENPLNTSRKS